MDQQSKMDQPTKTNLSLKMDHNYSETTSGNVLRSPYLNFLATNNDIDFVPYFQNKQEKLKRKYMHQLSEPTGADDKTTCVVMDGLFRDLNEQAVLETLLDVVHMGKDLNTLGRDSGGNTVLHIAVTKNFLYLAETLLDYGINPYAEDKSGNIPLIVAIENKKDQMAAMILSKLPKFVVRRLFGDREATASGYEEAKPSERSTKTKYAENIIEPMFNLNYLIQHGLDQTLMHVLNSFMEKQQNGHYGVHVKLLETDDKGREPANPEFDLECHTAFQKLASFEREDVLYHPVIWASVEYKWTIWCKRRFLYHCCLYLFSLFSLSYSVVNGVAAPDVHSYDSLLQYSRAMFESISYLYSIRIFVREIRQMKKYKRKYFERIYNWLELSSSILLMITLPLRYTYTDAHWYTFAVGYFLWTLRIFKYAKGFINAGFYSEIIRRIIVQDFAQFSILFLIINTIFSGTFLLVLKADGGLYMQNETSSFQEIMYVGLRTLIEAAPIVNYTDSDGYRTVGTFVMLLFMFLTIVVLLNILIAQISETYTRTHDDSLKTVRDYRALIVARSERNECHCQPRLSNRVRYYKRKISDVDLKALERITSSEKEVLSNITAIRNKQIKDGLEIQTVKTRQWGFNKRLEEKVDKLCDRLEEIEKLVKPSDSK